MQNKVRKAQENVFFYINANQISYSIYNLCLFIIHLLFTRTRRQTNRTFGLRALTADCKQRGSSALSISKYFIYFSSSLHLIDLSLLCGALTRVLSS